MNLKTVVIVALVAIGLLVAWTQFGARAQSELPEVRIGYLPVGPYAMPLFTALERGYFEQEGIRVSATRMESPNQIVEGLVSGRFDAGDPTVAAGIIAIANDKQQGVIKVFGLACGTTDASHVAEVLVARKGSNITDFAGLRGRRLAVIPSAQWMTISRKLLQSSGVGLNETQVIGITVGEQLAALESNSVDAVLALEPNGLIAQERGIGMVVQRAPLAKLLGGNACVGAGVVSAKYAREHPAEAAAFVRAIRRAMSDVNSGSANRSLMTKYLAVPKSVADGVSLPVFEADLANNPGVLADYDGLLGVFYELNMTGRRLTPQELLWRP